MGSYLPCLRAQTGTLVPPVVRPSLRGISRLLRRQVKHVWHFILKSPHQCYTVAITTALTMPAATTYTRLSIILCDHGADAHTRFTEAEAAPRASGARARRECRRRSPLRVQSRVAAQRRRCYPTRLPTVPLRRRRLPRRR